jgi:integrase
MTTSDSAVRDSRRRARRSQFGSIRQLPSGRFQARYSDPRGNRHTCPTTFASRKEAQQWLSTVQADLVRGTWRGPQVGQVTLQDFAADYLGSRVDLAESTRVLYRNLLTAWFARPLALAPAPGRKGRTITLGDHELRSLTVRTVREWHSAAIHTAHSQAQARARAAAQRSIQRAGHPARIWARDAGLAVKATGKLPAAVLAAWQQAGCPDPSLPEHLAHVDRNAGRVQVAQAYRLLNLLCNTAVREGLIDANPCQIPGGGQVRARERVPASAADIVQLVDHVPDYFRAALLVAAYSGLRAGELFGLARQHVDEHAGTVRVERQLVQLPGRPLTFGQPKTPASLRTVFLPPHVVNELRHHLALFTDPDPNALVFTDAQGRPITSGKRTTLFRAACEAIGRPDLRWHDLRHTGATLAAQAGATIRELQHRLGHATPAAAMIYQHASADRDRELAQRLTAMTHPTDSGNVIALGSRVSA